MVLIIIPRNASYLKCGRPKKYVPPISSGNKKIILKKISSRRFIGQLYTIKAAYSVTMNIFRKKKYFLFKSFVKVELSYVFTIKMFSTAENCMEK